MAGRGRCREGLAQMRRETQNLQGHVMDLTNELINQRLIKRDESDEEINHKHVDR